MGRQNMHTFVHYGDHLMRSGYTKSVGIFCVLCFIVHVQFLEATKTFVCDNENDLRMCEEQNKNAFWIYEKLHEFSGIGTFFLFGDYH